MDWQDYYIKKTRKLWSEDQPRFLDELVSPVPPLFRHVAKQKIVGEIGELAWKKSAKYMTRALIIKDYIKATPKRDHKLLRKTLIKHTIDTLPYDQFF